MGLIAGLLNIIFGHDRNVLKETAEVFRANAEDDAERAQKLRIEVLKQFGAEFESRNDGTFDRVMDGINRIPRPALALGTLGLFVSAMVNPIWFAERMQGIALVPEPLWWLLGVVVSFYFGARHQMKSQQFQRSVAQSTARATAVVENLNALQALRQSQAGAADTVPDAQLSADALEPGSNRALQDWREAKRGAATK